MKDVIKVEFEMEQQMSPMAKKGDSDYFEHQLQLRFRHLDLENEELVMSEKEKAMKILTNNFNTINKIDELDNGFDVYFGNHSSMNKLLNLFSKDYLVEEKRSRTLTGVDQLKSINRYRYYQSIGLIYLKRGDKVMIKGIPYYIKALNKNDLVLRHLENGSKKVVSYVIVKDYLELIKE